MTTNTTTEQALPKHPAPFPEYVLAAVRRLLPKGKVFDPMGGIGRLGRIGAGWEVTSLEIEQKWAIQAMDNGCVAYHVCNSRHIPFMSESWPAACTSPSYGNRLADKYNPAAGKKADSKSHRTRRTYRIFLGDELSPDSGAGMHWHNDSRGDAYRELHEAVWREVFRVLQKGGVFVFNMKDHVRQGVRQHVTRWHHKTLADIGFKWRGGFSMGTPGDQNTNRHRSAGQETVDFEDVSCWMKPRHGLEDMQAFPPWAE